MLDTWVAYIGEHGRPLSQPQEGLLNHVLVLPPLPHEGAGVLQEARLVPADQILEGSDLTGVPGSQKVSVRAGFHRLDYGPSTPGPRQLLGLFLSDVMIGDMEIDPNAPAGPESGIFGLESTPKDAAVIVLPVPFDATASYRRGAAEGPEAVLRASRQVDLMDPVTGSPWREGIWMAPIDPVVEAWNDRARAAADRRAVAEVNGLGDELNAWVEERTEQALADGKLAITLGGDHSVSFGAIRAHARRHPGMGLLHFDAHADLRVAYEGYTWSHASILHNVIDRIEEIPTVVQVGVRDLCDQELEAIEGSGQRIRTLFDHEWAEARLTGGDLTGLVERTLAPLPQEVYVTFDIDGLDPTLCPGTGTPVPGGLNWHEAMLWLSALARSGRRIVGADLTEVAPRGAGPEEDSWDAIVGARLLYRLIGYALQTGRSV